jgi:hypothetical protein
VVDFYLIYVLHNCLIYTNLCNTFIAMTKPKLEDHARVGRPRLPEVEKAITGSLRLTPARWQKLRRLGMAWLIKAIYRAKESKE